MTRYGYLLSCEEYGPAELVQQARLAEEAGFEALWIADHFHRVPPNPDFVRLFRDSGGGDRPVQGGLKVAWHPDAGQARKTMHRLWPTGAIPGEAAQLLPLPRHFGQLAELVSDDMISAPCGPDPATHADGIRAYTKAGFDEVYVGQIGGEAEGFFEFYAGQVLPRLREGS